MTYGMGALIVSAVVVAIVVGALRSVVRWLEEGSER